MRIAHVTKAFSSNGGIATYVMRLREAQRRAGHDVFVLHADKNGPHDTAQGLHRIEDFDLADAGRAKAEEALAAVEAFRPDIVHVQDNNNYAVEELLRARFRCVRSIHVYDFCPSGNKYHYFTGQACGIGTSPACLPMMVVRRCTQSKRPGVIWNFYRHTVEANRNFAKYRKLILPSEYAKRMALQTGFTEQQVEALTFFTEYGPVEKRMDEKMVLFAGRVVAEKGLSHLLKAVSKLRPGSFRLLVNGDGPALGAAKKEAADLKLGNSVEFAGWLGREAHAEAYRRASVVVVPSIWPEPFGLVGIEAMSHAKPVVAFASGGIPEWLEDGVTGYLVKTGDVEGLTEKIRSLLEDRVKALQMGAAGREQVEKYFNAERHLDALMRIYEAA